MTDFEGTHWAAFESGDGGGEGAARTGGKRSVAVQIGGHEYRILSDADEAWLHQVAGHVDDAMQRIRERTGTVDSKDVAVLTALNLAREVVTARELAAAASANIDAARLRAIIELAESPVTNLPPAPHVDPESKALAETAEGDTPPR